MKITSEDKLDRFWVVVAGLVLAGVLVVGTPAHSQTIHLKELASITTTKMDAAGDLTTRIDSYLTDVAQYFAKTEQCSGTRLTSNDKADFIVGFWVAHILQEYTITYEVADRSGLVLGTKTIHSIPDVAKGACTLIESRKHHKREREDEHRERTKPRLWQR